MIKNKIKINQLRDMYAKALYKATKDTKGYKYLLFGRNTGLQNDGCEIDVEDVRWYMLTKKVRHMIDMWIRLSMAKKNSVQFHLGEDDLEKVSSYSVPTGHVAQLINFSGKVGLTEDLAETGHCVVQSVYAFEEGEELDQLTEKVNEMFNKTAKYAKVDGVSLNDITPYLISLMDPISPETLNSYYKVVNSYINFNVDKVSKQHASIHDFSGFKKGKCVHYISGLSDRKFGAEAVSILNIGSPFAVALDDITEDIKVVSTSAAVEWIAESFEGNN